MCGKRTIYVNNKIGVLTQGSIINGCIAEDFPNEEVYGCVVTPRCALSHQGKVSSVHYIPVIRFRRWFDVVAKPIIKIQWKNELRDKINQALRNANLGADVMSANLGFDDMLLLANQIKKAKDKDKIIANLSAYFDKESESFNKYLKDGKGKVLDYIRNLKENKLAPYYLIEGWNSNERDSYYVLMLRDVRRLQIDIANKIKNGVNESDISPIDLYHNDLYVSTKQDNFFWVETQLASPFVEHILQAFIHNFSQIGVEDISGDTTERLIQSII